jgi:membrane protein
MTAIRERFHGSLLEDLAKQLNSLDFSNQAILVGAGLLTSLLPFLILLSSFASERVDDDIARRLGLDRRAAGIVTRLFPSSPASVNAATITSLIFVLAGTLAVASSLQHIYEQVFQQDHRGFRDVHRWLIWIAVLCGILALESVVDRPAQRLAGGNALIELITFALFAPFFWWTMHFLLGGRVGWWDLAPSAVATGVLFAILGAFSRLYFSASIISDSKTYGAIGAVFGILTWLIGIGAVVVIGACAGGAWQRRRSGPGHTKPGRTNGTTTRGTIVDSAGKPTRDRKDI